MSYRCRAAVVVMVLGAWSGYAPAADDERLPTTDELRQMYNDEQYAPLLQKLARVLQLKGKAAIGYDRAELLLLKGDTHLQLKAGSAAVEAYAAAAKEATDPPDKAMAQAMTLLVRRSKAFGYAPKVKGKEPTTQPYNILDPDQRKAALSALFADVSAELEPKLKAAGKAASLPPVLAVVTDIAALRELERAATGGEQATKVMLSDLTDHARSLMGDALTKMGRRIEAIWKEANKVVDYTEWEADPNVPNAMHAVRRQRKRGLEMAELGELKRIIAECDRIVAAAADVAKALEADTKTFQQVEDDAVKVRARADSVLGTDYTAQRTARPAR